MSLSRKASVGQRNEMSSAVAKSQRASPRLYKKLKVDFEQQEEQITLETRKKRLEELRSFNKQVTKTELADHISKYEREKLVKRDAFKQKNAAEQQKEAERIDKLPTFAIMKSSNELEGSPPRSKVNHVIDKLKQPGGLFGHEQEKKLEADKKKEMAERAKKYCEEIKKPKIDSTKKAEMEQLREKAMNENTYTKQPVPTSHQDRPWQKNMSKEGATKQSPDQAQKSPVKQKVQDYLTERRVQKQKAEKDQFDGSFGGGKNGNSPVSDVYLTKILNDKTMSEYERMEAVRLRATQIEQKALMSEVKLRHQSDAISVSDIAQSNAVNDVYLDSIQAKLRILEQI